jgi:protein SCO1/2
MVRASLIPMHVAALFLIVVAGAANAQSSTYRSAKLSGHETKITVPDVTLHDSEGREQELSRLMHDRVVILNFIFTSCTTICPTLSAIMQETERQLADRLGKDSILVSISVDPVNDSPNRLRAYREKIGAGPNWYWLTAGTSDIERTLRAFGIPTGGRPENHPPTFLVGNTTTDQWLRWIGVTTPEDLTNAVNAVSDTAYRNKESHVQSR